MQSSPLDEAPVVGALDRDVTPTGVVFRRLPAWTRPQLVDVTLAALVTMPAGVRLELLTDSATLELDVMVTAVQIGEELSPPTFDLVVDGEVRDSATPATYETWVIDLRTQALTVVPGKPARVRFDLPGDPAVPVEVWLPHFALVELRGVWVTSGAEVRPAPRPARRWVHYGSSISHCAEAPNPTGTWPAVAARRAGVDLLNLAVAGQCLLDQHVARTIRDLPVDLISVKAGINVVNADAMRERTFVAALHGFLDTVRDGHPTTPFVLATPIFCPVAEDHPGPTMPDDDGRTAVVPRSPELAQGALTLRRIRTLMASVVDARKDEHLHLVEGLDLFGPGDVDDLPDGLHPNADGYRRIGERFHALVFSGEGPFA